MADQFVQIAPDSTGKKVDTSELVVNSQTVERQRVVLADSTAAANFAAVDASGNVHVVQSDAVSLYSGTIAVTGAGSALDTSGFESVTIQAFNVFVAEVYVEGSNDTTNWATLLVLPLDNYALADHIEVAGNYSVKCSTRYIRYNVQSLSASIGLTILGRSAAGPTAADAVSLAMSDQSTPLNVNLASGVRLDASKAILLSDGIQYNVFMATGSAPSVIDLTGYQSVGIHITSGTAALTQSNDGVNFVSCFATAPTVAAPSASPSSSNLWSTPVLGRWMRLAGSVFPFVAAIVLKQAPYTGAAAQVNSGLGVTNLTAVAGTAPPSAGVAGILSVGGNVAAAGAATANPLPIGGVDAGNLTRRLLTDTAGAAAVGGVDATGVARRLLTDVAGRQIITGQIPTSFQNQPAVNVQDTAQFEGQSIVELLMAILLELQIANQQRYELPSLLGPQSPFSPAFSYAFGSGANQNAGASWDPPEAYRADPTIFKQ